jgi:hypothetical protein
MYRSRGTVTRRDTYSANNGTARGTAIETLTVT